MVPMYSLYDYYMQIAQSNFIKGRNRFRVILKVSLRQRENFAYVRKQFGVWKIQIVLNETNNF